MKAIDLENAQTVTSPIQASRQQRDLMQGFIILTAIASALMAVVFFTAGQYTGSLLLITYGLLTFLSRSLLQSAVNMHRAQYFQVVIGLIFPILNALFSPQHLSIVPLCTTSFVWILALEFLKSDGWPVIRLLSVCLLTLMATVFTEIIGEPPALSALLRSAYQVVWAAYFLALIAVIVTLFGEQIKRSKKSIQDLTISNRKLIRHVRMQEKELTDIRQILEDTNDALKVSMVKMQTITKAHIELNENMLKSKFKNLN